MKKGIKNLAIATMVGVASMGLMTGCGKQDSKPYIQVSGLDTGYMVGEEINLDGAKILYFSDENDTTADEIKLTESMVANFNTETEGEKKMKVFWNGFELEIDYSVKSTTDFINIFNKAYDSLLNEQYVHVDAVNYENNVEDSRVFYNIKNNKIYYSIGHLAHNYEIYEQGWVENTNDVWYDYFKENEDYDKVDVTDEVIDNNVLTYFGQMILGVPGRLSEDFLSEYDMDLSIDFDGNKTKLAISRVSVDDNGGGVYTSIFKLKYSIENDKFIKVEISEEDVESGECFYGEGTFSYNEEDVEMVELPGNIEWTE